METESSAAPGKNTITPAAYFSSGHEREKGAATCGVPRLHQIFLHHASDSRRTNGRHAYQVLNRGNGLRVLRHQVAEASHHPLAPGRRSHEDIRRRSTLELFTKHHSGNWRERYFHPALPNVRAEPPT